jgi:predicted RNase H-like HicB family nuclease
MKKKFLVVYEWAGKNFSGYAPDVAGCIATAKTLPKMRAMLKSALEAHLQWLKDDGDLIPTASDQVTVDIKNDAKFPYKPGYYAIVEKLNISMPKRKRASNRKSVLRELTAA